MPQHKAFGRSSWRHVSRFQLVPDSAFGMMFLFFCRFWLSSLASASFSKRQRCEIRREHVRHASGAPKERRDMPCPVGRPQSKGGSTYSLFIPLHTPCLPWFPTHLRGKKQKGSFGERIWSEHQKAGLLGSLVQGVCTLAPLDLS